MIEIAVFWALRSASNAEVVIFELPYQVNRKVSSGPVTTAKKPSKSLTFFAYIHFWLCLSKIRKKGHFIMLDFRDLDEFSSWIKMILAKFPNIIVLSMNIDNSWIFQFFTKWAWVETQICIRILRHFIHSEIVSHKIPFLEPNKSISKLPSPLMDN